MAPTELGLLVLTSDNRVVESLATVARTRLLKAEIKPRLHWLT
jgi:hypothetical protein